MGWEVHLRRKQSTAPTPHSAAVPAGPLPTVVPVRCIHGGGVTVGRSADVCIDPNPKSVVSKKHATIYWEDDSFHITDHNSTNGTFVNGIKVRHSSLKEGDAVIFGGGANIEFGKSMSAEQQANVQLLEWTFHVIESPAQNHVTAKKSPVTVPPSSQRKRPATPPSTHSVSHTSPRTADEIIPVPSSPGAPSSSQEPPHSKQRVTIGPRDVSPVVSPHGSSAPPPPAEDPLPSHDPEALTKEDEEWLIGSDSGDSQLLSHLPPDVPLQQSLSSRTSILQPAPAEDTAAQPPPPLSQLAAVSQLENSVYFVRDDSDDSAESFDVDREPSQNAMTISQPSTSTMPTTESTARARRSLWTASSADKNPKRPQRRITRSTAAKDEFEVLEDVHVASFDDIMPSSSQPPQLPPITNPPPFEEIPRQPLVSVRIGLAKVSALTPMEFTETQWKVTVEDPNSSNRGGNLRLIVNVAHVAWYKDSQRHCFFVIGLKRSLPGVEPSIFDPDANDLKRRSVVFECKSPAELKKLSTRIIDSYAACLTPDICDVVPSKEVYKYLHG